MKRFISLFHPKLPVFLVYMLQQVEYQPKPFMRWLLRLPYYPKIMKRQTLVPTFKAKILVAYGYFVWLILIGIVVLLAAAVDPYFIIGIIFTADLMTISYVFLVVVGWYVVERPGRNQEITVSKKIFENTKAVKIAVLGSYGKTTVKEILNTVLSDYMKVAMTPGNKNVAISHARWAKKLAGDEEVLIIEYGEEVPGDIAKFAETTQPDYALITGLAPNHLDHYKTLAALKRDLVSIKKFVAPEKLFFDQTLEQGKMQTYTEKGTAEVNISDVKLDITGMEFYCKIRGKEMAMSTNLVGRHLLGPIAAAVDIALKLGLSMEQIKKSVAKTRPFPHRLEPKNFHGAWIIDDAYNGSLEGFRAGLSLLKELSAVRKIYVTPGLVEQGEETERVHQEIGRLILDCNPDKVVLMLNSNTKFIEQGLSGFQGELEVNDQPLDFYNNLEHILAKGDLLLMQNDLTDNYY